MPALLGLDSRVKKIDSESLFIGDGWVAGAKRQSSDHESQTSHNQTKPHHFNGILQTRLSFYVLFEGARWALSASGEEGGRGDA